MREMSRYLHLATNAISPLWASLWPRAMTYVRSNDAWSCKGPQKGCAVVRDAMSTELKLAAHRRTMHCVCCVSWSELKLIGVHSDGFTERRYVRLPLLLLSLGLTVPSKSYVAITLHREVGWPREQHSK